jgi:hypothetical protein
MWTRSLIRPTTSRPLLSFQSIIPSSSSSFRSFPSPSILSLRSFSQSHARRILIGRRITGERGAGVGKGSLRRGITPLTSSTKASFHSSPSSRDVFFVSRSSSFSFLLSALSTPPKRRQGRKNSPSEFY